MRGSTLTYGTATLLLAFPSLSGCGTSSPTSNGGPGGRTYVGAAGGVTGNLGRGGTGGGAGAIAGRTGAGAGGAGAAAVTQSGAGLGATFGGMGSAAGSEGGGDSGGAGTNGAGANGNSGTETGGTSVAGISGQGAGGVGTGGAGISGKAGAVGAAGAPPTVTFHNGVFWNDTTGKRIEAHGGGFLRVGDTWYWFGEDKSQNSGTFHAVNCYASKDLVTWQFRNAVLTRSTATQLNTADRIIERPKVIYNDSTKRYVMWAHWDNGSYSEASAGVFSSATVDGNYTFVKSFKPLGNMSRDCSLFKEDTGTAYFMSAANNNADMMVYQLTDDYLDVKQLTVKLWAGASREAPAMFKASGTYFMITSAATGWAPNHAQYASAAAVKGPWSSLTDLGTSATTWDSQPTYVIPVAGSETTTYLYAGDHWTYPQLVNSQYVWLPLGVSGTKLSLNYSAQLSLDLGTGRVN